MHLKSASTSLALGATLAICALSTTSPALASAATGPRSVVSSDLLGGQLGHLRALGKTNPNKRVYFAFIFTERHVRALEATAERGFKRHLTVAQFAARYGAPMYAVQELERYLARYGITTQLVPGRVELSAHGTIAQFEAALKITERSFVSAAHRSTLTQELIPAQTFYASIKQPTLPESIAKHLVAILGTNGEAVAASDLARAPQDSNQTASSASGGLCGRGSSDRYACNTPRSFANTYDLTGLYKRGFKGQGQTIGIVTYAAADRGAGPYYWRHVLGLKPSGRTLRFVSVDGGTGKDWDGTSESDLDIEMSGGLAPDANIVVYQAANNSAGQVSGLFAAASQDVAGTVSLSWGVSDTILKAAAAVGRQSPGYARADDEALLELAAQGQASFVAAGDSGAYTASDFQDLGTTNLSSSSPADSPYTTSAGGTTLKFSATWQSILSSSKPLTVSVAAQRAWGWDYLWADEAEQEDLPEAIVAKQMVTGGGGGYSSIESEPSYQRGVSGTSRFSYVEYLTPSAFKLKDTILLPTKWKFNPDPIVQTGTATGRATPDLSADADPESGYEFYGPVYGSNTQIWGDVLENYAGGTSFVAPLLNGAAAVIDSSLHRRVGFWNPLIYKAARLKNSPFTPLDQSSTTNDNLYYTGTPGDLYNPATGLGTPNLTKLATDFAKGL